MPKHPANKLARRKISKIRNAKRGASRLESPRGNLPKNLRNTVSTLPLARMKYLSETKALTPEAARRASHHIPFSVPKKLEFPQREEIKRRGVLNWNKMKVRPER